MLGFPFMAVFNGNVSHVPTSHETSRPQALRTASILDAHHPYHSLTNPPIHPSMIISNSITVGQLTFILRVAVQLLSYAGPALIGILILSSIPRLAPIDTHDVVNRIVGASTATLSTAKWIINHIRRNPADPTPPTNLLLILILSITYTIFVSLSDIGFLGFYACSIPGHDSLEFPASLTSEDAARSFISTNMINGTDLATVTAWRCDSSSPFPNSSLSDCTSWHNSTYDDPTLFAGINSTDSDVLVSRQLRHYTLQEDESYDINAFYLGPDTQPLTTPTIINGLAINPHPTGVQVITGLPQLEADQNVTIPQTLAIEVEVGCMTLGLQSVQQIGDLSGFDFLVVDDTWQKYSGPDYLYDTLYQAANATRQYLQPFFDPSTLSNGIIRSFNSSSAPLSAAAKVTQFYLPYQNVLDLGKADSSLLANCTANLQTQLGLTPPPDVTNSSSTSDPLQMCGYVGIGGSMATQGTVGLVFQSMICAAATQVNMVSSTITVSSTANITTNITSSRSQSTLNHVRADFFDNNATLIGGLSGINANLIFLPYERYTLTPSSNGPTSHFISPSTLSLTNSQVGP
ncbi:hypothetical protein H0H93_005705, partial [Arthromyces matolae]